MYNYDRNHCEQPVPTLHIVLKVENSISQHCSLVHMRTLELVFLSMFPMFAIDICHILLSDALIGYKIFHPIHYVIYYQEKKMSKQLCVTKDIICEPVLKKTMSNVQLIYQILR